MQTDGSIAYILVSDTFLSKFETLYGEGVKIFWTSQSTVGRKRLCPSRKFHVFAVDGKMMETPSAKLKS